MSWFDPSGIASLAKNALKEAQKTIDKALDIQDDDAAVSPTDSAHPPAGPAAMSEGNMSRSTGSVSSKAGRRSQMKQSTSHPSLPPNSIWGSFTGSFFENPNGEESKTVTTPPSASSTPLEDEDAVGPQPHSVRDAQQRRKKSESRDSAQLLSESSGSVEVVSPPTTPGSSLTSPDATSLINPSGSESSVGVLEQTPTSDELVTVSSTPSEHFDEANFYVPDNLDIISDDISLEEDSRSFNTVTEATIFEGIHKAPSRSSLHLDLVSNASSSETPLHQVQTVQPDVLDADDRSRLSDSTQSFEYVNLVQNHPTTIATTTTTDTRAISPASSLGDRSEIVKINSSGHTSGDDVETATSSDIEIISSPNGCDSSSTNSVCKVSPSMCQSGVAVRESTTQLAVGATVSSSKKKGHFRESSTHSIPSTASDDSRFAPFHYDAQECERLRRRVAELSEVLEAREQKLIDLGHTNSAMHEQIMELQAALDAKRKRDDCLEVSTVTEEYTHRLSALEKKFQQSIRERDNLRDQIRNTQAELTGKVTAGEMDDMRKEKDFLISELQLEGEKLSKQVLQHSNIIKKLRAKEKESDAQLKGNREQLEELHDEVERLKKTLSAKDEVERTQIEAVHKLSGARRKLDKENAQLRSQLEDAEQKLATIQTSFDAAKREIHDKQDASGQLARITKQLATVEAEKRISDDKALQLQSELASLRERLRQNEGGTSAKEMALRQENHQLLRRLEDVEQTLEQQTNAVTTATIPLVRQMDALQATLNQRTLNWERLERELIEKLETAQSQHREWSNTEKMAGEKITKSALTIQRLEEQLAATSLKAEQASSVLQQRTVEFELGEQDLRRRLCEVQEFLESSRKAEEKAILELTQLQQQQQHKQQQLKLVVSEPCKVIDADEIESGARNLTVVLKDEDETHQSNASSSPTLSLGRMSLADSLSSNMWPMEDIDCISNSGRTNAISGLLGVTGNHHTSMLESLQSNLKQRDGENHQLQWELSRLESERSGLMQELSRVTEELCDLKEQGAANASAAEQFGDLQQKYDALLQMYGEKVEEIQELHLDLDDVKEMYRGQLDELMLQLRDAKRHSAAQ